MAQPFNPAQRFTILILERLSQLEEFARKNEGGWRLNEERVNDAWFVWIIVNYYQGKNSLQEVEINVKYNEKSRHMNTETLCESVWKDIWRQRGLCYDGWERVSEKRKMCIA